MRRWFGFAMPLLAAICFGCQDWTLRDKESVTPLSPVKMNRDSAALEVISLRVPVRDLPDLERAWRSLDEQAIAKEFRDRLQRNGIRAGKSGAELPEPLLSWIAPRPEDGDLKAAPTSPRNETGADISSTKENGQQFTTDARVSSSVLQGGAGVRKEVLISDILPELSMLLVDDGGQVTGRTYKMAQGVVAVWSHPLGDGGVRLDLQPELHHGDAQQKFLPLDGGGFRIDASRTRVPFDEMRFSCSLAPGESIVLGESASTKGGLGHSFFGRAGADGKEQKILIIRLVATQHDAVFNPARRAAAQ